MQSPDVLEPVQVKVRTPKCLNKGSFHTSRNSCSAVIYKMTLISIVLLLQPREELAWIAAGARFFILAENVSVVLRKFGLPGELTSERGRPAFLCGG